MRVRIISAVPKSQQFVFQNLLREDQAVPLLYKFAVTRESSVTATLGKQRSYTLEELSGDKVRRQEGAASPKPIADQLLADVHGPPVARTANLQLKLAYVLAQVELMAVLCAGRNETSASVIRTRFCDFEACFQALSSDKISDKLRRRTWPGPLKRVHPALCSSRESRPAEVAWWHLHQSLATCCCSALWMSNPMRPS